jgi:hypothetical protein
VSRKSDDGRNNVEEWRVVKEYSRKGPRRPKHRSEGRVNGRETPRGRRRHRGSASREDLVKQKNGYEGDLSSVPEDGVEYGNKFPGHSFLRNNSLIVGDSYRDRGDKTGPSKVGVDPRKVVHLIIHELIF